MLVTLTPVIIFNSDELAVKDVKVLILAADAVTSVPPNLS